MNGKYLVFGATGGIGGEVCRQFIGRVEALGLSGRDKGKLQDLAAKTSSRCYPADADDWEAVDAVVKQAKGEMNGLDGVAICIGSILLKSAHLTKRDEFEAVMSTNLTAPFGIVRAAAKAMVSTGGSIVLVSSAAAQKGLSNHEAIAAAKAGIEGRLGKVEDVANAIVWLMSPAQSWITGQVIGVDGGLAKCLPKGRA